jgi:hypothetical protein
LDGAGAWEVEGRDATVGIYRLSPFIFQL